MRVSFVIMTHNRRGVLAETLGRLPGLMAGDGLAPGDWEAVVADNGSTDGTGARLAEIAGRPDARVVPLILGENLGCQARNAGVARARGEVVVFLDDDSWPRPGAVAGVLARMAAEPGLGVLGGAVYLPDGRQDYGALPRVPPGCALAVRRTAFQRAGGFDAGFGMAAEEFELVCRVLAAGFAAERDATLGFEHLKTPVARRPARIAKLDLRNNLIVLDRWVSEPLRSELKSDWTQRYAALLHDAGADADPAAVGREAAAYPRSAACEPPAAGAAPLGDGAIEALFGFAAIQRSLAAWSDARGVRRVMLLGYTKTLLPVWRAGEALKLEVVGVADDGPAFAGLNYRGVPVLTTAAAGRHAFDAWLLTNRNPAQKARQAASVAGDGRPVWGLEEGGNRRGSQERAGDR